MRIAVNCRAIYVEKGYRTAGVARVAIQGLRALALHRPNDIFSVYLNHESGPPDEWSDLPNIRTTIVSKYRLYEHGAGLRERALGAKAWFCPAGYTVERGWMPQVTNVNDFFPVTHPEWFDRPEAYADLAMRAVRDSHSFVTISEATREELRSIDPDAAARCRVAYLGPGAAVVPADVDPRSEGVTGRYALLVSTLEPRKNVGTAIRAIRALRARPGFGDVSLVLIGGTGWNAEETEREIAASASGEVFRLGYRSDEEMAGWRAKASVLVVPSLSEGFGMPALEAMLAGTPLVVARAGALPEVVGDAARTHAPLDADEMADRLAETLTDPTALIERARERADRFTWPKAAAVWWQAIEEAAR